MRRTVVLLTVITLLAAHLAAAADFDAPFDDIPALDVSPSLAMFFHRNETAVVSSDGMTSFEPPADQILVARVTADGELVTYCVATKEALRRALDRNHRVESPVQEK